MVSSVLAHVGNEMIRAEVLPRLLSGDTMVCLGYTEPDSGSDVAAARTRAVRDGDGWRIDGQKMFTSVAEEADWIFLLTRTSSEGAKHAGLTFFLVPMDTPGISLQEVRTLPASASTSPSSTTCASATSGASVRSTGLAGHAVACRSSAGSPVACATASGSSACSTT